MESTAPLFVLGSFVTACSAKVPRFPRPGESLCAQSFTLEAGGKGFNLMLGAHRLGAGVDGLLPIGGDAFGRIAEETVARCGLPAAVLRRYPTATGSGIGFIDADGENCLAVFPGANGALAAADVRAAAANLRRSALVLAQFEIADAPVAEAFAQARAAGRPTLLNPSPLRPLGPGILEHTSILVLNRVEAAHLAALLGIADAAGPEEAGPEGAGPEEAAAVAGALLRRGPETVVVTLGRQGAVACRRDGTRIHQPAFPVTTLDTLGAGDAFTSGLAVGLAEGRPWADCLRRAAACGALTTRRLGVFDALPTRAELEGFLAGVP
ncbi:ribokinase [Azospirillum sp. ST 5-10]|uniref:ribokinase n=1 Tax=unclassified Azospirillum TaxID=2630922 RepID=UPI003F49F26C